MIDKSFITQSISFDEETNRMLSVMAESDDRSRSALVRFLVRKEYANRFSTPNPLITVAEAETATQLATAK